MSRTPSSEILSMVGSRATRSHMGRATIAYYARPWRGEMRFG
jgi:hypothetical protein